MSTQDLHMEQPTGARPERVVEYEFQFPRLKDIHAPKVEMPEVNLEPVRAAAEKALLITIGAGVLVGRGLVSLANSAARAGEDAAKHPGPVTRTLLGLVRRGERKPSSVEEARVNVPMMPIAGYDELTTADVLARLAMLTPEQLRAVRDYERANQNREVVLSAIEQRLSA